MRNLDWLYDTNEQFRGACHEAAKEWLGTTSANFAGAWLEEEHADEPCTVPNRAHGTGADDTREKLEADIRGKCTLDSEWVNFVTVDEAICWLDRQAAITERECREYEDALREQHHGRTAALKAEIATLKEHRAGNMDKLRELTDECAELHKYRDEWKGLAEKYRADSIAAQAECEQYRAKLGAVLDAIHDAEEAAR